MIVASASPTIVQKESTESGAYSAPPSNGASSATSPAIEASACADLAANSAPSPMVQETAAAASINLIEELGVRVTGGPAGVLAIAAAAASDGQATPGEAQLATVATQFTGEQVPGQSTGSQSHQHAPLNSSSTMKQNVVPKVAGSKRLASSASGECALHAL